MTSIETTAAPAAPVADGEIVVYDYGAAAMSCQMNGRRIRGIGRVTGREDDNWLIIDSRLRVHRDEIALRGTHAFAPDASGYGCTVCGFNDSAEIHSAG